MNHPARVELEDDEKIIEAHRGTIALESQVGLGSTFLVSLPLDNAEELQWLVINTPIFAAISDQELDESTLGLVPE